MYPSLGEYLFFPESAHLSLAITPSIRNFLLPHIVAHPTEAELFMARTWGEMDGVSPFR